ncbi:hypothetical protein TrLO_g10016 [Triparma laevis f. longispina]|uniref:Uncharacterized protein n=1 Tax=Triparma laevis f. longispina TaxID=1714387 RepID=A0A9W6ZS70_9STRA|nr:hypothetical protein TrLO_g10016 [Triparma laevis f. longispina]
MKNKFRVPFNGTFQHLRSKFERGKGHFRKGRQRRGRDQRSSVFSTQLAGKEIIDEKHVIFKNGEPDNSVTPASDGDLIGWVWRVQGSGYFWSRHKSNGNPQDAQMLFREDRGDCFEVTTFKGKKKKKEGGVY